MSLTPDLPGPDSPAGNHALGECNGQNREAATLAGPDASTGHEDGLGHGNGRVAVPLAGLESGLPAHEPVRPMTGNPSNRERRDDRSFPEAPVYGALDLGTNNCRLLLAKPTRRGFRVVDAFSRIIRLGEGVSQSNRLSDDAMRRTMEALKVCAGKIQRHGVIRTRMVATQACRIAENGSDFVSAVRDRFGLDIEVLTPETEARLAVSGCASLVDPHSDYVVVFDIGGGSSEIIWLDMTRVRKGSPQVRYEVNEAIVAWTSLPVGVVTLAERFDGRHVTPEIFAAMSASVSALLEPFEHEHRFRSRIAGRSVHMLGTSGTVTTIAGINLNLPRYDRNKVDGLWLQAAEIHNVSSQLVGRSYEERIAEPCIGRERADLVLAGCAILDAIMRMWPASRLRVADRGLREGILTTLMIEDGVWRSGRRRRRREGWKADA
jgi:exopolyphosphatase / guanosine-5'-triphosphate,3'-diphosphate pyrophosphatase